MSEKEKVQLLHSIDQRARGYDPQISQVEASYREHRRRVWIYNSKGYWAEDERNTVQFLIVAMAQKDSLVQRGIAALGGQLGLELFDRQDPLIEAQRAAESAVRMLEARPSPAGEMTVVMSHGWGGVLFHEACGHALEADHINQGASIFAGRLAEQVASPLITIIDDSTLQARGGSFRFDDDGTSPQWTVLIDEEVQKEYTWDLAQARKANYHSTGNAQRSSNQDLPSPAPTNFYLEPSSQPQQKVIAGVGKGLYMTKSMNTGGISPTNGDYSVGASGFGIAHGEGELTCGSSLSTAPLGREQSSSEV